MKQFKRDFYDYVDREATSDELRSVSGFVLLLVIFPLLLIVTASLIWYAKT